jgi:hypothetical protein
MPWNPKLYPDNWNELAWACKYRAGFQCERCGSADGMWRIGRHQAYKVWLTAAHLDHDPENPNPRLMAMCQDCHLKYDAMEHGRNARQTKCRKKYEAEIEVGQLELFSEDKSEGRKLA